MLVMAIYENYLCVKLGAGRHVYSVVACKFLSEFFLVKNPGQELHCEYAHFIPYCYMRVFCPVSWVFWHISLLCYLLHLDYNFELRSEIFQNNLVIVAAILILTKLTQRKM